MCACVGMGAKKRKRSSHLLNLLPRLRLLLGEGVHGCARQHIEVAGLDGPHSGCALRLEEQAHLPKVVRGSKNVQELYRVCA